VHAVNYIILSNGTLNPYQKEYSLLKGTQRNTHIIKRNSKEYSYYLKGTQRNTHHGILILFKRNSKEYSSWNTHIIKRNSKEYSSLNRNTHLIKRNFKEYSSNHYVKWNTHIMISRLAKPLVVVASIYSSSCDWTN